MKAKDLNNITGKILNLTKLVYLEKPDDGSGLVERFIPKRGSEHPLLASSFGMEWWVTSRTLECCQDIADMSISFDPQLEAGDKESFVEIIRETLRENVRNENLFILDSIFFKRSGTLFGARAIKNPTVFATYLWNEIHSNLVDSRVKWLTMYPLRLVRADSYELGFNGLTLLKSSDQQKWGEISEQILGITTLDA